MHLFDAKYFIVLGLAMTLSAAQAVQPIWDSSQTTDLGQLLSLPIEPSDPFGQTITIQHRGLLMGIALAASYHSSSSEDFRVALHSIDSAGKFSESNQEANASISQQPSEMQAEPDWVYLTFDRPLDVSTGQRFAFLISDPTPSAMFYASASSADPYAEGSGIGFRGDLAFVIRLQQIPEPVSSLMMLASLTLGFPRKRRGRIGIKAF